MALMAESALAAMDDAGVRRAVLVAHSNGAPVAQLLLARHPERVLAFVDIDGPLRRTFDRATFEKIFADFLGDQWPAAMAGMIDGMPAPGLSRQDRETIKTMALASRQRAVVEAAEATLDETGWPDGPIRVPLLMILAAQPTWVAEYEAWVRSRAPQVDYRTWTGVGHFVQMERPAELRATLFEFLDANDLLR
jgi:pimeloyl-ACP methyl ester carboxylesterase